VRAGRFAAALCTAVSLLAASSCDSGGVDSPSRDDSSKERAVRPEPVQRRPSDRSSATRKPPRPSVKRATCPSDAGNCRSASGVVLYVERVDPDGDGDAHFVLASRQSITAPGISVIDVKQSLRPSPLPGSGDRLSAAGPVYRGSFGQRQIEAVELNVARAR
jgi:hypothetical protein